MEILVGGGGTCYITVKMLQIKTNTPYTFCIKCQTFGKGPKCEREERNIDHVLVSVNLIMTKVIDIFVLLMRSADTRHTK